MDRRKVVITGAAGSVGQVLLRALPQRYEILAVDRRRVQGVRSMRTSISSVRRLVRAFRDADAVVHLAADASWNASWKSVRKNNVIGTRNVLEAARLCGVKRVVFASSNAVAAGYEKDEPWASVVAGRYEGLEPGRLPRISSAMPVRAPNLYGVSKAFGEAACRYYSDEFGLSIICLRIGTLRPSDRPSRPRHFATMITHRDLVELVTHAIEAPEQVRFEIVYGVSDNTWRLYDLAGAEHIGFVPVDNVEIWRAESSAQQPIS